jgi:hypothetical protein
MGEWWWWALQGVTVVVLAYGLAIHLRLWAIDRKKRH